MTRLIMPQCSFTAKTFGKDYGAPAGALHWLLLALLVMGLSACERNGAAIPQSQYQAALVGGWQGTVGDEQETISFTKDGRFTAQLLRKGFISNTLGQGEAGTINGSWELQGVMIALTIDSTENLQTQNFATTSTIVSLRQNELIIRSDSGQTSTFVRAL